MSRAGGDIFSIFVVTILRRRCYGHRNHLGSKTIGKAFSADLALTRANSEWASSEAWIPILPPSKLNLALFKRLPSTSWKTDQPEPQAAVAMSIQTVPFQISPLPPMPQGCLILEWLNMFAKTALLRRERVISSHSQAGVNSEILLSRHRFSTASLTILFSECLPSVCRFSRQTRIAPSSLSEARHRPVEHPLPPKIA